MALGDLRMTNDQSPVNEMPQRARYERPVVIELDVTGATDGKLLNYASENGMSLGPS